MGHANGAGLTRMAHLKPGAKTGLVIPRKFFVEPKEASVNQNTRGRPFY
jgi:hypothetical protein